MKTYTMVAPQSDDMLFNVYVGVVSNCDRAMISKFVVGEELVSDETFKYVLKLPRPRLISIT